MLLPMSMKITTDKGRITEKTLPRGKWNFKKLPEIRMTYPFRSIKLIFQAIPERYEDTILEKSKTRPKSGQNLLIFMRSYSLIVPYLVYADIRRLFIRSVQN